MHLLKIKFLRTRRALCCFATILCRHRYALFAYYNDSWPLPINQIGASIVFSNFYYCYIFFDLHSIRAVDTSILNYALEYLIDVMEQQDNSQWTTAREHEKKMFIQKVRFIDHFIMWMNCKRHHTESSMETNNT